MPLQPVQRAILLQWILVFLALTLACFVAAFACPLRYQGAWMYFCGTFSVISVLFMVQVTRSVQQDAVRSGSGVLGAIAVKQLSSMVFIIVYLFTFYGKDRGEIIVCLLCYFLYSVVAWYFAYQLNRRQPS